MNSKLIKASVAGAAVVAIAAGGGTFANWSDFSLQNGNTAAAGHLVLNVGAPAVNLAQAPLRLAPGQNAFHSFTIASNDGQSVPTGLLSITMNNLVNHEDGCTSASEAVTEGVSVADAGVGNYDPTTACGSTAADNNAGELGSEARMEIIQYGPSDNGQCSKVAPEAGVPSTVVQNFTTVNGLNGVKKAVATLTPGQLTCIGVTVNLLPNPSPVAADNKVQGDSMAWDFRFDLEQV